MVADNVKKNVFFCHVIRTAWQILAIARSTEMSAFWRKAELANGESWKTEAHIVRGGACVEGGVESAETHNNTKKMIEPQWNPIWRDNRGNTKRRRRAELRWNSVSDEIL